MELDTKRLVIGLVLVFLLGVSFAVVNGWYAATEGTQLPIIVYGISFLSVLLGAFIVVLFQWRINRAQINHLLKLLPREERLIVKVLLDNNNQLEQNKLVALSGLTKVQVSRTTSKLEERDVLEKKPLGNTKLVILKL